jgi:hypothetical protein
MLLLTRQDMAMGLGFHFWDIPMTDYMVPFQVYTLAGTMVYSLSLAFSKISILFLYLRLSTVRWFRILVWILLGIVVSYAVIYNLISLFGCKPIAASWDLSLAPTAKCLDQLTKYMVSVRGSDAQSWLTLCRLCLSSTSSSMSSSSSSRFPLSSRSRCRTARRSQFA